MRLALGKKGVAGPALAAQVSYAQKERPEPHGTWQWCQEWASGGCVLIKGYFTSPMTVFFSSSSVSLIMGHWQRQRAWCSMVEKGEHPL